MTNRLSPYLEPELIANAKRKIIKVPLAGVFVPGKHQKNILKLVELGVGERLAGHLSEDEASDLLAAITQVRRIYAESDIS